MNHPQVSVIIVSYNYGHLIEETLESVFAQSYPAERTEVIVVNDGSTDDTEERLEKYREKIRYFHQTNSGVSSAINLGIERAGESSSDSLARCLAEYTGIADDLPSDLAANLDHYLHGHPKRQ